MMLTIKKVCQGYEDSCNESPLTYKLWIHALEVHDRFGVQMDISFLGCGSKVNMKSLFLHFSSAAEYIMASKLPTI